MLSNSEMETDIPHQARGDVAFSVTQASDLRVYPVKVSNSENLDIGAESGGVSGREDEESQWAG